MEGTKPHEIVGADPLKVDAVVPAEVFEADLPLEPFHFLVGNTRHVIGLRRAKNRRFCEEKPVKCVFRDSRRRYNKTNRFIYQGLTAMSLILSPDMTQGRPARRPRTPFGERLAQARERAGLTQVQLAEKLGTTQGNVTSWEREVVALRPEQLNALADVLDVSADYLLGRKNGKHVTPKRPIAKVQQIFERVNKLPRHQQSKVAEFVEAYVNQYTSKVS